MHDSVLHKIYIKYVTTKPIKITLLYTDSLGTVWNIIIFRAHFQFFSNHMTMITSDLLSAMKLRQRWVYTFLFTEKCSHISLIIKFLVFATWCHVKRAPYVKYSCFGYSHYRRQKIFYTLLDVGIPRLLPITSILCCLIFY